MSAYKINKQMASTTDIVYHPSQRFSDKIDISNNKPSLDEN